MSSIQREKVCFLIAFVVCAAFIGYPLYLLTDRRLPFSFISATIGPSATVRAGDHISIEFTITKPVRSCSGTVYAYFVDSGRKLTALEPNKAIYAKHESLNRERAQFSRQRIVPFMAAGEAYYQSRTVFECNWLQAYFNRWFPLEHLSPPVGMTVLPPTIILIPQAGLGIIQ